MTLTISGSLTFGPSWEALEQMIGSMIGDGRLTRISRRDGGVNYRASSGIYDLTFVPETGDATEIILHVN